MKRSRRPATRTRAAGPAALFVLLLASVGHPATPPTAGPATNPYPGYRSEIYADPAHWLCRPDEADVCDHDLDATIVRASGETRRERWRPAEQPKIDCFYVYPTISTDEAGNSDLVPGEDQELYVVRQQAARLGSECRVFAPVYRQVTLTALTARLAGQPMEADSALAYGDVLDAWKHYVANDNQGRGVVLIGHSQGSGHLTALIRDEIDPDPRLRDRLVSAMLLGTNLQVPEGRDVGGDFAHVPLCRRHDQTGCAVAYASFRATEPPPADSFFGVSRRAGWQAACVSPAAPSGGRATLHPYLPTSGQSLPGSTQPEAPPWVDPALGVEIPTPLVTLPGFVSAECAEHDGFVYLAIDVAKDPSDPRIDDIGGDLTPQWGLHLIDVSVAMGDLVALAGSQSRAYCARHAACAASRRRVPSRLR